MALTDDQLNYLRSYWSATIKIIYPDIDSIMVPSLLDSTIAEMLTHWNHSIYTAPTEEQIEQAFLNSVYPDIQAEIDAKVALLSRLEVSILFTKTPVEVAALVETQINAWTSLADAKTDLYNWLPVVGAALAYLLQNSSSTD